MKVPSEHDEQVVVCKWLDLLGVTYYAVPNGSNKSLTAQRKFKAEGLKAGVPDMVILLEGGRSVYIEMKRVKGSTTSKEQKEWQERLRVLGFSAHICKGASEAIKAIESHFPETKRNISTKQGKLL